VRRGRTRESSQERGQGWRRGGQHRTPSPSSLQECDESRRLALKKDPLHELTPDELGGVVGGITTLQIKSLQDCSGAPTLPLVKCVTAATS
jgi:hypothetical protein